MECIDKKEYYSFRDLFININTSFIIFIFYISLATIYMQIIWYIPLIPAILYLLDWLGITYKFLQFFNGKKIEKPKPLIYAANFILIIFIITPLNILMLMNSNGVIMYLLLTLTIIQSASAIILITKYSKMIKHEEDIN